MERVKNSLADSSRQEWLDLHYVSDEGFASLSKILEVAEPRVKALQLIEKNVSPDIKKYLLLLYAFGGNLLSFAGYTPKKYTTLLRVSIKQAS